MPRTRSQRAATADDIATASPPPASRMRAARDRRAARMRETRQLPTTQAAHHDDDNDDDRLDTTTAVALNEFRPPAPKRRRPAPAGVESQPPAPDGVDDEPPAPVAAGATLPYTAGPASCASVLSSSSIPELTTRAVRKILTAQRRALLTACCLDPVEEVHPGWSRLEFNFRYTQGMARNRHAKHQRDSARAAASVA